MAADTSVAQDALAQPRGGLWHLDVRVTLGRRRLRDVVDVQDDRSSDQPGPDGDHPALPADGSQVGGPVPSLNDMEADGGMQNRYGHKPA